MSNADSIEQKRCFGESVTTIIETKVQNIQSEFQVGKANLTEENVDQFIQELIGYSKVLEMTSEAQVCDEQSYTLPTDIANLLNELSRFKTYLTNKRQVLSKIIDMETEFLKSKTIWGQARSTGDKAKGMEIQKVVSLNIKELEDMQIMPQYKERVKSLIGDFHEILQEIDLTMSKIEEFDNQFFSLQQRYEQVLQTIKTTNNLSESLRDLERIKLFAENLHEISEETKAGKHNFLCSINRDLEKFTCFIEIENNRMQLVNSLRNLTSAWNQLKNDLSVKTYTGNSLKEAETVLNDVLHSMDESVQELKLKIGNSSLETNVNVIKPESIDELQMKFQDIKKQVRDSSVGNDGSEFLKIAADIRKLQSNVVDHPVLLKEVENYSKFIEEEANNLNYLSGIEAKATEIENLISEGTDVSIVQNELDRFKNMLTQNSFKSYISKIEDRQNRLLLRVKEQQFQLDKLKAKARRDEILAQEKLTEIEKKLKTLEPEVRSYAGLRNETKHYELNETITRAILQLDTIEIKNDETQKKKFLLLRKLHELGEILDRNTTDSEIVSKLYTHINDLLVFLKFGDCNEEEFRRIKSTCCNLRYEKDLLRVDDVLQEKLAECDKNLISLEKIIKSKESNAKMSQNLYMRK